MLYFILGYITGIVLFVIFQLFLLGADSDIEEDLFENYERKK